MILKRFFILELLVFSLRTDSEIEKGKKVDSSCKFVNRVCAQATRFMNKI